MNLLPSTRINRTSPAVGSIYPNFLDWQSQNHTFAAMAIAEGYGFSLTGLGDAEQVSAEFVSSDFFKILGVGPTLGRSFAPGGRPSWWAAHRVGE